jgi:hypothetical protein
LVFSFAVGFSGKVGFRVALVFSFAVGFSGKVGLRIGFVFSLAVGFSRRKEALFCSGALAPFA